MTKNNDLFKGKKAKSDKGDIVIINPPPSCYSSDTEVMTSGGWKLIKDVDMDKDMIMSLNPKTKFIEMVKAVDFVSAPVNGKLYHFSLTRGDFCVTGNHNMVCLSEDKIALKKAKDIEMTDKAPLEGFFLERN